MKNGIAPSGSQKYECKDCSYAFVEHPKNKPIREETKSCVDPYVKRETILEPSIARSLKIGKTWLQSYVNNKYKISLKQSSIPREGLG